MGTHRKRGTRTAVWCVLPSLLLLAPLSLVACSSSADLTAPMAASPLPTPAASGVIAFERAAASGTSADLYLVNADGTGLKQLTQDPGLEDCPAWSPDGSKIAYGVVKHGLGWGDGSVWVMNADGSGQLELTKGESPSWSPDGKQIAFIRGVDKGWAIHVINADGSGLKQVTDGSGMDLSPSWAPDGRIVFLRTEEAHVYGVNPDGSGLVQLAKGAEVSYYGLSPDGTQLAIEDKTNNRIEAIPLAGGATPLTLVGYVNDFMVAGAAALSWTPDGTAVALASNPNADHLVGSRLYVVNADGSGLSAVPGVSDAMAPAWRPE